MLKLAFIVAFLAAMAATASAQFNCGDAGFTMADCETACGGTPVSTSNGCECGYGVVCTGTFAEGGSSTSTPTCANERITMSICTSICGEIGSTVASTTDGCECAVGIICTGAFASTPTCVESSITESICSFACAESGSTVASTTNGCECASGVICTGTFASTPSCADYGVAESTCTFACAEGGSSVASTSNGCECASGLLCATPFASGSGSGASASSDTMGSSASSDTMSESSTDPAFTYADGLAEALGGSPAACQDAVRTLYTRTFHNCLHEQEASAYFALFAALSSFNTQYALGSAGFGLNADQNEALCGNMCLAELAGAFGTLATDAPAECIAAVPEEVSAEDFAAVKPALQLYCATGGSGMCGAIADAVNDVIVSGNGTLTMETCNLFNMYGKCLGNFRAFGNEQQDGLGDSVATLIASTCMDTYNVDVSSASTGTEAPAAIGSSASATYASLAMAVVAAILALLI